MSTDDIRIHSLKPLIAPAILIEDLPLSAAASKNILQARAAATHIIQGKEDRLLVVVGPCSIHDPKAAREYAAHIRKLSAELSQELLILMRVYFEKPRTTLGWKGLIHDPALDNSFQINQGLRIARKLLVDLAETGVPTATEFLDTITPQFISDAISWAAIGARTTESQIHRELASGLSVPVGFKNGTDGNIQIALDAIFSAQHPHHFLSVTKQGIPAIVNTMGNDACHLVLRGGREPNYFAAHIHEVSAKLKEKNLNPGVMIDCSHGNSQKNYTQQSKVLNDIATQISAGEKAIAGVMLESHLVEGRQALKSASDLEYGKSITDACMGWNETEDLLRVLAQAVKQRRVYGE